MATKFIAPSVSFTENDQSFISQGVGDIGAAIIGRTQKGEAFVPTKVSSISDFNLAFGINDGTSYVPQLTREYLTNAGTATIVRLLGIGGYSHDNIGHLVLSGSFGENVIGTIHRSTAITSQDPTDDLGASTLIHSGGNDFYLTAEGTNTGESTIFSGSLLSTDSNYISKILSRSEQTSDAVYAYTLFDNSVKELYTTDSNAILDLRFTDMNMLVDYSNAYTPYITSQNIGGTAINLFKFIRKTSGLYSNTEVKIAIDNIKFANEVPGSDYGTFDVYIRQIDDNDRQVKILESFSNLNLDPTSPNYILRRIGDKIPIYSDGKILNIGDYDSLSDYITVEVTDSVKLGTISKSLVPFGFTALTQPMILPTGTTYPTASYNTTQEYNSQYNSKVYYGFNFDFVNTDNYEYLKPIEVNSTVGNNVDFSLNDYTIHADSPEDAGVSIIDSDVTTARKFAVPFQGGFDGEDPATVKNMGSDITATNTSGFDVSSSTASGSIAYSRALTLLSNAYQYDIKLLFAPGIIYSLHPYIATKMVDLCEDRGDVFTVIDTVQLKSSVKVASQSATSLDTSYAATYYPWIKMLDIDTNQYRWYPPTVAIAGAFAYNDRYGYEWYAPAGLNRGGLTTVTDSYIPLDKDDLETLYQNRINPIIKFPDTGFTTWGQKTLQAKSSALDRINVRRLLINIKKFLANVGKSVLFEPNNRLTRTNLYNQINPYMEQLQERNGLYASKVVLDETVNTSDLIDRNIMKGVLYLKPTKTTEMIQFDLNILPSGLEINE